MEINVFLGTVRSAECEYLVKDARCDLGKGYCANLRALSSWHKQQALSTPTKRTSTSSHVNFRYLNAPEKAKQLANCSTEAKVAKKKVKRLEQKLKELLEKDVIPLDDTLHQDFDSIISDSTNDVRNHFPPGTFQRIFSDQKVEALKLRNPRQV